jgi:hypothetical protein
MNSARISYVTRPDSTKQAEVAVLANIYKFVLACHEKKEATCPGSPDDAKGSSDDRARSSIPDR